jgi:hypothetical protein
LIHNFIEAPCSVLHRRAQLPETDVFNTTVQGAEDYELYLRIARHSPMVVHDAVVAEYRLHEDSLSHNAERMILVTDRVLQLERMHLGASRTKAHQLDMGCVFARRLYGRRLTRELIRSGSVRSCGAAIPWVLWPWPFAGCCRHACSNSSIPPASNLLHLPLRRSLETRRAAVRLCAAPQ